jgi:pimeloyl-ACP methyl ester carboxylesterase
MPIEHKFIDVAGVKCHYLLAGEGQETILLLHGGGLDYAELSWELLIPYLAEKYRVIAPDWPGYGQSDKPHVKFNVQYYVGFLKQLIDSLQITKASLVGISMGGAITLGFALENPDMVDKLVLVDSYGLQRKAPMHKLSYLYIHIPGARALTYWMMRSRAMVKYSLSSILKQPGSLTDELIDLVHDQVKKPGVAKAFSDLQDGDLTWNGLKTNYLDRLHEIVKPTLIIHGGKDSLVPLNCSREAQRLIKGSKLYIMAGSGHWPQRDNPAEFNRVVKDFFFN